jgi:RNA:NAD 2'-phosphotransferase (TPT1/KptA family)
MDSAGWMKLADAAGLCRVSTSSIVRQVHWDAKHSKGRFQLKEEGGVWYIRACQGHVSRPWLDWTHVSPDKAVCDFTVPEGQYGYHVTSGDVLGKIMYEGLLRMDRTAVHAAYASQKEMVREMEEDSIIIRIDLWGMILTGHDVRIAANGVLQMEHVPPMFLDVVDDIP